MWIAFKLVSLQLQTQLWNKPTKAGFVVNCFQISIFAVANTTYQNRKRKVYLLWIAFKLVSLQLQTQLDSQPMRHTIVVNCFQISIFAVANTTVTYSFKSVFELWIAFKLVSLQLQTQPQPNSISMSLRCELLSN